MDIKALLAKSGCKEELVESIYAALDSYKSTIQEQCQAEYTAKLKKAQQVCLEETEAHKRELSRRLEIFCEAKGNAIEAYLKKQSALSESEATSKLKTIKLQLEGIQVNGMQSGELAAETAKANRKIQQLSEERDRAITAYNRANAIAEKTLKHNRQLAKQVQSISESVAKPPARPTGRIDAGRSNGRPVTTRPTLTESQDRRPVKPQQRRQNVTSQEPAGRGFGIQDIAAQIDEI